MRHSSYNLPQVILIFNIHQTLISITRSIQAASLLTTYTPQAISKASNGKMYGDYYFRKIPSNIEIDVSDLGVLQLKEFDRISGIKIEYHKSKKRFPYKIRKV